MKKTLTVYFDYVCPYCYRSIMNLLDLLPDYPKLSVCWVPCEAHPRPEAAFIHSDLASQAMLAAADQNCDLVRFHREIFAAHFTGRRRINNAAVLADIAASCGADRDKILRALKQNQYRQAVLDNNRLVWDTLGFEAVPCYQSGDKLLASHEDVIISNAQLEGFLSSLH